MILPWIVQHALSAPGARVIYVVTGTAEDIDAVQSFGSSMTRLSSGVFGTKSMGTLILWNYERPAFDIPAGKKFRVLIQPGLIGVTEAPLFFHVKHDSQTSQLDVTVSIPGGGSEVAATLSFPYARLSNRLSYLLGLAHGTLLKTPAGLWFSNGTETTVHLQNSLGVRTEVSGVTPRTSLKHNGRNFQLCPDATKQILFLETR